MARRIVEWSTERRLKHRGQGNMAHNKGIAYMPVIPAIDWFVPFAAHSKTGRVGLEGSSIGGKGLKPYGNEGSFGRLLKKLKAVPGVAQDKTTYPDIMLPALANDATFEAFFEVMAEIVRQVRRANT